MIKGTQVILYDKVEIGKDPFNQPLYEESEIIVDDVLISPSTSDDVITSTDLVGKQAKYTLAIPKGDTHKWENKKVRFFDKDWYVFGFTIQGIEANVPTRWHKKVMVERYE